MVQPKKMNINENLWIENVFLLASGF